MSEREAADAVRAAAERLRKHKSVDYEKSPYFFPDSHYIPGLIDNKKRQADVELLANAYIATVAADEQLKQRLQANAKYFDDCATWAKKEWNDQAASMATEAADRFRAALNIAMPSDGASGSDGEGTRQ